MGTKIQRGPISMAPMASMAPMVPMDPMDSAPPVSFSDQRKSFIKEEEAKRARL